MLPPEQLEQQQSVWGEMAAMIREMRVLRIAHSIRNETGRRIVAAQRVNDLHSGFLKPFASTVGRGLQCMHHI
jgi:hypothetical protein